MTAPTATRPFLGRGWSFPVGLELADAGVISGTTATTLTDAAKAWQPDEHAGALLVVTAPSGARVRQTVVSNTATAVTVATAWATPPAVSSGYEIRRTRIAEAAEDEKVRQAISLVLGTARGERVMRPDFGCGLHDLVFALNDAATVARVADTVREALLRWEPRIDLLDVRVSGSGADASALLIGIEYRVRSTNNLFNVVYPFYLERSAT
jgi:phage baseplate assembly protein W